MDRLEGVKAKLAQPVGNVGPSEVELPLVRLLVVGEEFLEAGIDHQLADAGLSVAGDAADLDRAGAFGDQLRHLVVGVLEALDRGGRVDPAGLGRFEGQRGQLVGGQAPADAGVGRENGGVEGGPPRLPPCRAVDKVCEAHGVWTFGRGLMRGLADLPPP